MTKRESPADASEFQVQHGDGVYGGRVSLLREAMSELLNDMRAACDRMTKLAKHPLDAYRPVYIVNPTERATKTDAEITESRPPDFWMPVSPYQIPGHLRFTAPS